MMYAGPISKGFTMNFREPFHSTAMWSESTDKNRNAANLVQKYIFS